MRTLLLLEEQEERGAAKMNGVVVPGPKRFLTESQVKSFLAASRKGRHGVRDFAMMLMTYRHGLRVSELTQFRLDDVDMEAGQMFVRRQKGSISTSQPIEGDEIRALRAWLSKRGGMAHKRSVNLFVSEKGDQFTRQALNYLCKEIAKRMDPPAHVFPHMLRHSCGHALAEAGKDTRLIQDWLGHKCIANTELYTRTSAKRFEGLWG